ncbi:hypothetical protein KBB89_03950 [Candidatus Gracilibacteria bacterium]|nr:hypothetical protein [Candidatus Gracilibacteria bacterium]
METKTTIVRRLIPLLNASTMSYKERMLWLVMIPTMSEELLLKLEKSIVKESDALTELYIKNITAA